MLKRNRSMRTAVLAACTALVPLVAAPTAQAAPTEGITTVMRSRVELRGMYDAERDEVRPRAVGATLSIIHICPTGSVVDRPFLTKVAGMGTLNSTRAAGFKLLSREWWPRGMVSRWRVTSNAEGEILQTIACREQIPSGITEHVTPVSVTLRLWGPVRYASSMFTETVFRVWRGQQSVREEVQRLRATKNALADTAVIVDIDGDSFGGTGVVRRSYAVGRYAETKFSVRVKTPGVHCAGCGEDGR